MFKFFIMMLLISCSTPTIKTQGGEYSSKEISYCGGVIDGYFLRLYATDSRPNKSPALAVWVYVVPSSHAVILNYVLGAKSSLDVNFNNRNLYYQILGDEQRKQEMSLELTIAANSADNAYPYPDYTVKSHNPGQNQWKIYKRGLMGDMFLTDYKVVTLPRDQHKKVLSNTVRETFDSQFHEGIYIGEGVQINFGIVNKSKLLVKTPAFTVNGVELSAQVLSFDIDFNKFETSSRAKCPTISDIFRWN